MGINITRETVFQNKKGDCQIYLLNILTDFAEEHASLQAQDKDKEIAELKDENKMYFKTMESIRDFFRDNNIKMNADNPDTLLTHFILKGQDYLNEYRFHLSTIESQQKEIEELKQGNKAKGVKIIEDAVKILQLQSQLDEVKKERDESNRIMVNRLLIMKDWLNPEPFSDIDACLNAIEHAIKSLTPTKGD